MASPEQRLRELERSELFSPDFPRRRHLTHAQWAGLSEEQRLEARAAQTTAIRRAKNSSALVDIVQEIGRARQESAVALLAKLWSDCALEPVRIAAGHALRAIGSHEARAALEALIEDADHLSVFFAVRAVFDTDPATAFDRFAPYFDVGRVSQPGGRVIPQEVLRTFGPDWNSDGRGQAGWTMEEPRWFERDERWMGLCVRLRHDAYLGRPAREALGLAEPERVKDMLSRTRASEGPRTVRRHSAASGDLLARYRRGEHEAVWNQLRAHEAIDADCRAEAIAVAIATMTRVARSADLLAERLTSRGWATVTGRLRWLPSAADSKIMDDIARFTGSPLPPSLLAFWERVGGIDFVWNYKTDEDAPDLGPGLAMPEMDPLYVDSAEHMTDLLSEWEERRSHVDPELDDPWNLDLAPDYLHKANISGGAPYGIELPHLGADPIFINEEHGLPFVEYLRLAFRWGGFPRLERYAHNVSVGQFVCEMTKDMEPF